MSYQFISLDRDGREPLQGQVRQAIIAAIHDGRLQPGQRLPSSRKLAQSLDIARNTATMAYDELVARGYLEARPRLGLFVAPMTRRPDLPGTALAPVDWERHLTAHPSRLDHIRKPPDWQSLGFPFLYGQVDPALFPLNAWRASSRDMLGRVSMDWWVADRAVEDDPALVEQIRSRILPERGIYARPEEILVTLGTQEGLYLTARLLGGPGRRVGIEMPGYPDARYIHQEAGAALVPLAVDAGGARLAGGLDLAVLTPGAHCPTMIAMTPERRDLWLERAAAEDFLIVEDDFEGETSFTGDLALKSQDRDGRVIYLGTFSKVLAPGVRLGFMVAPAALIEEARWLRRLVHRSAPLNNQRTAAIFLAEGHYLSLVRRLRSEYAERYYRAMEVLPRALPGFRLPEPCHGGSCIWLECPEGVGTAALAAEAAPEGVVFESGDPFVDAQGRDRFLRLGLNCIATAAIPEGLQRLGRAAARVARRT